jgi:hypothetical protein
MVKAPGFTEITGAGGGVGGLVALPTPFTDNVYGLPEALCEKTSEAVFAPAESGMKETTKIRLSLGFRAAEVGTTENREALGPETVTEETLNAAVPVLLTVTIFWDVAPTLVVSIASEAGKTENRGAGGDTLAIPVTLTESGLLAALCANFNQTDLEPAESGAKVTINI